MCNIVVMVDRKLRTGVASRSLYSAADCKVSTVHRECSLITDGIKAHTYVVVNFTHVATSTAWVSHLPLFSI